MKYKWLNKQNNDKLIIFFNGWGMNEQVVKHLDFDGFDVIMFNDYNNLETDITLEEYPIKYLISWSMGVMVATLFNFSVNSSTAINGTLKPIDPEYGIHPRIYDLTVKGFNEKGREKFINNMFDSVEQVKPEYTNPSDRTIEDQKSELEVLKTYKANENFKYNRVIISDNDKIIPTKNQCSYWKAEPNLHAAHCPFLSFKKWSELL